MNHDEIVKEILQRADRLAAPPRPVTVDAGAIRRRAGAAQTAVRVGWLAGAGIAAALGVCVWLGLAREPRRHSGSDIPAAADSQRIAQLEAEVKTLRASSDRMFALLQETLEQRDRDRRVAELRKELAGIPEPMDRVKSQVNQAAERMVQEADELLRSRRQRALAAARYQRVIELFPDTEWASVARQRLEEIAGAKSKGEHI
jgi:hypothetical protein